MQNHLIPPRWGTYAVASRFSGLSTRLLEDLVKDELVISSLARRPGRSRGIRLIDLESLQNYIQSRQEAAPYNKGAKAGATTPPPKSARTSYSCGQSTYFGNGSTHNIGCVVRAPFVHVDLDSKPDAGSLGDGMALHINRISPRSPASAPAAGPTSPSSAATSPRR
jgi:hypothetical protein